MAGSEKAGIHKYFLKKSPQYGGIIPVTGDGYLNCCQWYLKLVALHLMHAHKSFLQG